MSKQLENKILNYYIDHNDFFHSYVGNNICDDKISLENKIIKKRSSMYKKINLIELMQIGTIEKVSHFKSYQSRYVVAEEEMFDIYDILDINLYSLGKAPACIHVKKDIIRNLHNAKYSFLYDGSNNHLYICFENQNDHAKYKLIYVKDIK